MSLNTGAGVLNGLSDEYAEIFGQKYSEQYRQHVAGKALAHDMTIEEYRANPILIGFGGEPGPEVGSVETISYPAEDGTQLELRVYYPKGVDRSGTAGSSSSSTQNQALPCYLNVHGGGFVIGAIDDDESFLRKVAHDVGCVAIDIGYRLAPEYKFPIPITDCRDAFKYLTQPSVASKVGIDPARIAVGGFSAGGHIAAEICLMARDEKWQHRPCFQLLVIPVCDASALDENLQVRKDCPYKSWQEHHDAPFLSHARMSWFYRYFLPEPVPKNLLTNPLLSPIQSKSLADLPPALVVPAEVDVLRDEGIAYANRLRQESGSWTQLWLARRVPHPFPHQTAATDVAVQFEQLACQRLEQAFKGELDNSKEWISNV